MDQIFFDSWPSIVRTATICVLAYVGLIAMLRIAGNRPLTQLNAFDFIVNVALGSTLATVMLNKNVALADGLLTFGLLIVLQLLINFLNKRYSTFRSMVKTKPVLLFYNGAFQEQSMATHMISKEELLQVMRSEGVADVGEIRAIVLETNGSFSVIKDNGNTSIRTLDGILE